MQHIKWINKDKAPSKMQTPHWDEATISHKRAVEALDRTLKHLHGNNKVMGGVTVILSGNFRQILPVIPQGTRADEINASVK